MTLAVSWVRTLSDTQELFLATDSRLTGGHTWDVGPKIMPLQRGDCALCFAGRTAYSYPLMLHIRNYIDMDDKAKSRALDLAELKGHLRRVVEDLIDQVGGSVSPPYEEFCLLIAGYSWRYSQFMIWALEYDDNMNSFYFRRATKHAKQTDSTKEFWFIGDQTTEAQARLYEILRSDERLKVGGLNMEPLQVLIEFIRNPEYNSIGGPPQVVKIYEHMNSLGLNVLWPSGDDGHLTYLGRRLLDYETNRRMVLDPDTLEVSSQTSG